MYVIDIETRSLCDIQEAGADAYSRHPSTQVMCLCYIDTETGEQGRVDFRDGQTWWPKKTTPILAHNITFEKAIFKNVMGIEPGLFRWLDSQNICAYMGAPLTLEGGAFFLLNDDDAVQKDKEGKKVMYKICRPANKKLSTFSKYTEEEFERLMDYCMQDCVVSLELYNRYHKRIPDSEWEVMELTNRLNDRGIPVDMPLVDALLDYYNETCRSCEAPEGLVPSDSRRTSFVQKMSAKWGYPMKNMQAATVTEALADPECPDPLRTLLETRQVMTLASIKKLHKLRVSCAGDPWVRNGFQYHGSKTGRYAGRGVQPQNLPRGYSSDDQIITARMLLGV